MCRLLHVVTLLACALGLSFMNARAQDKSQKIVKEGVEIEFTVEPATSLHKRTH